MSFPVVHIVRFKGERVDGYGKKIKSFASPEVVRASFAPGSTSEPRDGTVTRVDSQAQLVLAEPIPVDPRDYFLVNGNKYEVEGEPASWYGHYSRRQFGQIIYLRRFDG